MALDRYRIYTTPERADCKPRCPDCRAPLAITWRRTHQSGRSEDLYVIAKSSCPNRCSYDPGDLWGPGVAPS